MLSVQKCADKLREQAYKTLTTQIQAIDDELQDFDKLLSTGIRGVGQKLEALRHTEFPVTESILDEYLKDAIRKRDIEGEALALFIRGLRTKETQEEILTSLLDNTAKCFPRAALFTVRGDMFRGWSSRGFSGSTAATIGSDEFRQADCPCLLEVLKNGNPAKSAGLPDTGSLRLMRNESPGAWRFYPLHVLGRPVAILLAGEVEGFAGRPEALTVLMDCTALRLENVSLKIIKTLNESAPANAANLFTAEPSAGTPSIPQPTALISPYVLNLNLTAPIDIPEPVESVSKSYYESDAGVPTPLAGLKLSEPLPEPVDVLNLNLTAPIDMPEPVLAIPADAAPEHERETLVEPIPAAARPDAVYVVPPPQANPEDERLHAAAKRFAELLVSGIRLYNEDVVAEGRKNRDLYNRLQNSINRNREMYEKRVSPTVAQSIDYLHEEFVRILGDGDAGALGDGYPGPFVGKTSRIKRF